MIKGSLSTVRLNTVDRRLKGVILAVAADTDIMVIEGHRGKEQQDEYFARGLSKKRWPEGEHNTFPSRAADIAPHPWNPSDSEAFVRLNAKVQEKAAALGVRVRWGGDWDGDGDRTDQRFHDLVHFELI